MRLFLDIGVGRPNTEAWEREKDFDLMVGVEPSTKRYENLKNIYPGTLLNMAIADKEGFIYGYEAEEGDFELYIEPDSKLIYKKVKKKTTTLDVLWEKYGGDEVHIWADIEGSELLMLKGAKKLLASGKVKWINLEVRKNPPQVKGWCSAGEIYEFLNNFKPSILLKNLPEQGLRDVIFQPK